MRIYTGGGDGGDTSLFGGNRVSKGDARVEVYGTVDELNASLGLARTAGLPSDLDRLAGKLQAQLFVLGSDLAAPRADQPGAVRLESAAVPALEAEIDRSQAELEPLKSFILPGGSPAGAALHLARTVCRRAERRLVRLLEAEPEAAASHLLVYLNRLSDLLFVLARLANARAGAREQTWEPE